MTKLFITLFLHILMASPIFAYRAGAEESSCYDHAVVHDGAETFPCVPAPAPHPCPFFLRIREVVNEATLELGLNETDTYQCGRIYGIELANTLNDPEGFLIQARNGTDVSSEIIGEFLDPAVVQARNPAIQVNYKILSCNRSILDTESVNPLPNSATHPRTVDMAGVLQLYWKAPDCSTCGLGDLRIWFTAVQQLQIVFETSKTTILRLQNYTEPECSSPTTAAYTDMETPTTMYTTMRPTTESPEATMRPPQSDTCGTCNSYCQFNNVEVLGRIIETKINKYLANDPVIRTLTINVDDSRNLVVDLLTPQHGLQRLASVSISNPALASTSSNNLLAYRPNYDDFHPGNSNLSVVFLNLKGIFPCIPSETQIPCGVLLPEGDAFSGGRVFLQAVDRGNNFRIFSSTENLYTYGIAVQDCSQLSTSCWPTHVERGITCQLPRQYCS